ncbi:MAG: hypothetical protein JWM81_322 [Candidatus Saccharibacteria bacterium]|nr:hypothetical protein [Candidatus Saccharibacteria bacterium]
MSVELITTIAGGAGYAGGQVAEYVAQQYVAARRDSLAEAWGEGVRQEPSHLNIRRVIATGLAPLAIFGGIGVAVETLGWIPGDTHKEAPAPLVTAVDHSGTTRYSDDPTVDPTVTPFATINKLVTSVNTANPANQIILSTAGESKPRKLEDVMADMPSGGSDMVRATSQAISTVGQRTDAKAETGGNQGSNVLVVTYGHDIGQPDNVIAEAKASKTAVYVVDVKGTQSDPAVNTDLIKITKETGGQYWSGSAADEKKITKAIKGKFSGAQIETQVPYRNILRLLGGIGLIGVASTFAYRKNMTLQGRIKGE